MENFGADGDLKRLINELAHGKDAAMQLQMILNAPASSFSPETRELLVHNVLSSYDRALSMLNYSPEITPPQPPAPAAGPAFGMESPTSFTGSPHSEDSDREYDGSRKRNAPRWTQKIQVSPGTGLEGHLDDGYSWRKYGQKDILGARYPRGYYRCTHRHGQGCLATKQVQRSDEDPTIFDITYRGRHTCNQVGGNPNPPAPPQIPPQNQEPNMTINPFTQQGQPSETLLNFCRQLKVETSNLDNNNPQENQPFTYSYTLPSSSNINSDQSYDFRPPSMVDGNFSWSISPSFGSPASTTASSEFGCYPRQTREAPPASTTSTGIIPAVSAANSPTVDPGFAFGTVGFDSNFTFDSRGFFR